MNGWDDLRRGEIVIVNFADGYAAFGRRPAIVVQNDKGNRYSSSVIVVPITKVGKKPLPTHVWISAESGLREDGTALCEHIMTVYKVDIIRKIGWISQHEQWELDGALNVSLGLKDNGE